MLQSNMIPPHDEKGTNSCDRHGQDTCGDTNSEGPLNYLCEDWFQDTPLIVGGILLFSNLKPTSETLQNATDVYIIMPSLWQPHSDTYAHNENSRLDWEGNMRDWKDWEQWVVLDDIPEDTGIASGLHIHMECPGRRTIHRMKRSKPAMHIGTFPGIATKYHLSSRVCQQSWTRV